MRLLAISLLSSSLFAQIPFYMSNGGSSTGGTCATLAGDVTGTCAASTVVKINGVTVSGTPSSGQEIIATSSSAASWQTPPSTTPSSPASSVQFNNAGTFGGSTNYTWLNTAIAAPAAPTVTNPGSAGAISYQYQVSVNSAIGSSIASAATTIATGVALGNGGFDLRVASPSTCVAGLTYNVWRSGGSGLSGFRIVNGDSPTACGSAYDDLGVTSAQGPQNIGPPPVVDYSSGLLNLTNGRFSQMVASQNDVGDNGTVPFISGACAPQVIAEQFYSAHLADDLCGNTDYDFFNGMVGTSWNDAVEVVNIGHRGAHDGYINVAHNGAETVEMNASNGGQIYWSDPTFLSNPDARVYRSGAAALTFDDDNGGPVRVNIIGSIGFSDASVQSTAPKHSFVCNIGSATSTTVISTGDTGCYSDSGSLTGTINRVDVIGNAASLATCSITVDVWKRNATIPTASQKISASAPATLSTANVSQSGSLSGWTTTVANNDIFGATVASVTGCVYAQVRVEFQ